MLLIFIAIFAWVLHICLGWWQIYRFNQAFERLCQQGYRVGVGRSQGRFKAKAIIVVAFNNDNYVTNSLLMQGYTIFSRPKPVEALLGLHYEEIKPECIFPKSIAHQQALREALGLQ